MATYKKVVFIFLCTFLFSCEVATVMWTNQEYNGEITMADYVKDESIVENVVENYYYDMYDIGCAGTWEITVESKDNVFLFINITDGVGYTTYIVSGTGSIITFEKKFNTNFRIYLKVSADDILWNENGCVAGYSIKAVLK